MNITGKHRATLEAVFADPVRANIAWRDIGLLLTALDADLLKGMALASESLSTACAQCSIAPIGKKRRTEKETDKGAVKSVRRYPSEAGIKS